MNIENQLPDLDKMLSAFFKSEVPSPFPGVRPLLSKARMDMPMPASSAKADQEHLLISKSRISLAVSVALLLGGCWYLSSHMGDAPDRPGAAKGSGDGNATMPKAIRNALEEPKKTTNMP